MSNPISSSTVETTQRPGWSFPKDFWLANLMELCERAAYYGFFILLTVYLTDLVGFSDVMSGTISGLFAGFLYFLPPFSGATALLLRPTQPCAAATTRSPSPTPSDVRPPGRTT